MAQDDPKQTSLDIDQAPAAPDQDVISLEAELPSPDELEALIEPAAAPEDEGAASGDQSKEPDVQATEASPPQAAPEQLPAAAGPEQQPLQICSQREAPRADGTEPILGGFGKGSPRMVVAIASGKGGVGKSVLTSGVGVYLAQLGKRVVLVDANLGSGNLHTLLGMDEPRVSLSQLLNKEVGDIEEVVAKTPFKGLGLIPSHDNAAGTANPRQPQKSRMQSQIRTLAVDFVIVDLPGGSDYNTLDFFLCADLHVVVITPEPSAIESGFRLIKSAFVRKLRSQKGFNRLLTDLQATAHCGIPTPLQIHEVARERDPRLGEAIYKAMGEFKPRLVVNMTRMRDDLELGPALAAVGRRHLGLPLDYLGYVENEDVTWVTVRRRRPLLVEYPESKVAKDIERVTRRILSLETKERPECVGVPTPLSQQGHYEILGIHPGATVEEVRRAQRRAQRIYAADSTAIYGIAPPSEVSRMRTLIENAYGTLVDPEKRHLYDRRVFPGNTPADNIQEELPEKSPGSVLLDPQEPTPVTPLPEMPALTPETEFSGALLRKVREARGADLQEIAERTKISIAYLRAIEEEDFLSTPAPVYLRGFVKIIARDLKLDPEQVARTYMERYQAAQNPTPI